MAGIANRSLGAIEAIYTAASSPDRWPEALALVADHLGLSGGLIAFHPPSPHRPFTVVGRLREDLLQLYLRDYVVNPMAVAMQRVPPGVPYMADTLVDMSALRRSSFYADILAPQQIETQIAFNHPSLCWPGGSGGIAFMLSTRQSDDRTAIGRRLRPLVPHLLRAVDMSLTFGRQLTHGTSLERVLELMPGPAMLLNSEGRVSFANAAAEALLAESDGLTVNRTETPHLAATDAGEQRRLSQAIRTSLLLARGIRSEWVGTLKISRPSGLPALVVLATPLPAPFHPFALAMPSRACVLIQVLSSGRGRAYQADTLQRLYALTPAEGRVAALIGSGLSAPAVAQALGVSLTTVKSHLTRSFDKTGVRSQAELAYLVAQLPGTTGHSVMAPTSKHKPSMPPPIEGSGPGLGHAILRP